LNGFESAVRQLTIFCFYLQNGLIQSSKTGGQWNSDTSPLSIPWPNHTGTLGCLIKKKKKTGLVSVLLVKQVLGRGPEQRESGKTVLYLLIIIIVLIGYIIIYYY
jgi:hypothetical protein